MRSSTKAIGLSIISAFILSACYDLTNGAHGNTVKGAGIGAATGAVLGDDKQAIILGTAAGAVIGGVVGNSTP